VRGLARFHFALRRRNGQRTKNLAEVAGRLESVSASTEREFLDLGERLQEIVARASEQRARIACLLDTAGREAGGSITALLAEISSWTAGREAGAGRGDPFEDLLATVRTVRDPLERLANAVRTLRVVGVVTRVESARLGMEGSGFEALAGEVRNLADVIDEKSQAILEAVRRVCELLERTRQTAAAMERRQQAGIAVMTGECSAGVSELERQDRRVGEVSRCLGGNCDSFGARVGDIVAALQVHDNTRQRLEHIAQALREAPGAALSPTASGHLIELQAVQLEQARDGFLEAVAGIRSDLEQVGKSVSECVVMARELSGSTASSAQGFAADLERRLSAIAGAISEMAAARRAMAQAAAEVREACARMSGFVAEIEAIGERMLRLALNAQIQAVRLAETGVVMEAVAEGIRSSSYRASEGARAAGHALREIESAVGGMNALSGEGDKAGMAEAADLAARIRGRIAELRESHASNTRVLEAVAAESHRASGEIAALAAGIEAGRVLRQAADPAIGLLREMAAGLMPAGREAAAHAEALAAQGSKYTMHSERQAHEAFLAGSAPSPAAVAEPGGELGENVELF